VNAIEKCLKDNIRRRHEGICYLYGVIGEKVSLAVSAIKPESETTSGSFFVSAKSMARVVREAANDKLQVVGQVHTHPRLAFHSDGDDKGAHTAYDGYISIVLPNYGKELPSFNGAAFFVYVKGHGFIEVSSSKAIIVPEVLA
jgi:proteasome lid subunit RPN8/RPN11